MPVIDRWTMQSHESPFPSSSCLQAAAAQQHHAAGSTAEPDSIHDHEYKTVR